jgi:hypothetical protein
MSLLEGVVEVAQFLDIRHVPYAILGGIAVQHWGEPRTTLDIDVVVLVPPGSEDDFLRTVAKQFQPRFPDAIEFARKHRILLISTSTGIPVDLSLGIEGYEEEALSRRYQFRLPACLPYASSAQKILSFTNRLRGAPET